MSIQGLVDVHNVIFHHDDGTLRTHYVLCVYYGHWLAGEPDAATDARNARFVRIQDLTQYKLTPGVEAFVSRAAELIAGR